MVLHLKRYADRKIPLDQQVNPGEVVEINEIFYYVVGEKDHLRFMRCGTYDNFKPGRTIPANVVDSFAKRSSTAAKIYGREDTK